MGNIFNEDFQDFLRSLNKHNVEYVLIGGYAVIIHGYNRTTGGLDIFVNPSSDNYKKLKGAFGSFEMSMFNMTLSNFLDTEQHEVFSFGRSPVLIDIMTVAKGLSFDECYDQSELRLVDNIETRVIHLKTLKKAKKASNRPKDLEDIIQLSILEEE